MTIKRIIEALMRRWDQYVLIPIARRRFKNIQILSSEDSIRYIIEHRCSVSRFGDGEFFIMMGKAMGFQQPDSALAERLKQVLTSSDAPNHRIAIPLPLKGTSGLRPSSKEFWGYYTYRYGKKILPYLTTKRVYLDTQLSRFYIAYKDKRHCQRQLNLLKQIWDGKDIVIIEGNQSRTGIGNDLYDNARSIERILGPSKNAFSLYNQMLDTITQKVSKDKLILLSYGMTATVLAHDLAKLGYWAVDIGHLDIEYEWFRLRATENVVVKGKYTNEAKGGDAVDECSDAQYLSQIICDITR